MPYSTLNKHLVSSKDLSYERTVWLLDQAAQSSSELIVFLDAELYLERTSALKTIHRWRDAGLIPQGPVLFVSNNGAASRHEDFTCHPGYANFIASDVMDWARQSYPDVKDGVIFGLSLSGLAAAYIASRHPAVFRAAVCQSPSFWWDQARFADELPTSARPGQEYWICVGSDETSAGVSHPPSGLYQGMTQIAGCSQTVAALRSKGYEVSYREYRGGHDPACWGEDLALALPWVWRKRVEAELQSGSG